MQFFITSSYHYNHFNRLIKNVRIVIYHASNGDRKVSVGVIQNNSCRKIAEQHVIYAIGLKMLNV